jgi:hypothetical protein
MKLTNKVATLAATLITIGSLVGEANAALTLNIDTATERYWLTGSSTGQFGAFFENATWVIGSNSSRTDVGLVGDLTGIATTINSVSIISGGIGASGSGFTFNIKANSTDMTTITGSGEDFAIDYSGVAQAFKDNFESGLLTGFSNSETEGSTFGTLNIVAVPEPSAALLLGVGVLGFVTRRRRIN